MYCKVKWKLKTRQSLWYNGFTTNTMYSRVETSLRGKLYQFAVRNAIIKQTFIVMEKTNTDIKNISVRSAGISRYRKRRPRSAIWTIPLAQSAEKPCICTMTENITRITPALTRSAITLCLCQSLRPPQSHPCSNSPEKRISSECTILSVWSLWLWTCSV